jgi:amino acid adenylation domain-containing protein
MSEARFLHEYLLRSTAAPEAVAVRDMTGHPVRTYAELAADTEAVAAELGRLGLVTGDRVLLRLRAGAPALTAILASSMRGAIFVPTDPDAPAERVAAIEKLAEPALEVRACDGGGLVIERVGPSGHARRRLESDIAYIIFTSGTTGHPKGICMSHRAVLAFFRGMNAACPVAPTARLASVSPLHFDLSLLDLGQALGCGASIIHLDRRLVRSPRRFVAALAAADASQLNCVPSVWRILLRHVPELLPGLTSLRATLFAGESFPVPELTQLQELMPELDLINCFGQSESVASSFLVVPRPLPDATSAPIGPAHEGAELLVLSPAGLPAAPGETGEIYLRGATLFTGYWNDPEATRLALVPDPLDPRSPERVFRTGDLVRVGAAGELYYAGRRDLQVQILGNRVEPEEIERCIGQHDGVLDVAVYADDSSAGTRLIAIVVADEQVTGQALREFCADQLPDYMIPVEIRLVSALPRTTSGKLDRQRLAAAGGDRRTAR